MLKEISVLRTTWSDFTVDVTGTGGKDRLIIREVSGQSTDGLGALLDDFVLVASGTPISARASAAASLAVDNDMPMTPGDPDMFEISGGDDFLHDTFVFSDASDSRPDLDHDPDLDLVRTVTSGADLLAKSEGTEGESANYAVPVSGIATAAELDFWV